GTRSHVAGTATSARSGGGGGPARRLWGGLGRGGPKGGGPPDSRGFGEWKTRERGGGGRGDRFFLVSGGGEVLGVAFCGWGCAAHCTNQGFDECGSAITDEA